MSLERRYDLTNYTLPANCRGCRFSVDRAILDKDCPVHGVDSGPVVGPPDWPALITVRVED